MQSQIYYVIPREEEKFKETFFQGKIWHNKIWFIRNTFLKIREWYWEKIEGQREVYKEKKKENKKLLEKIIFELQEEIARFTAYPAQEEKYYDRKLKARLKWLIENFSFRNYKYIYLKWTNDKHPSKELKNIFPSWEENENILAQHEIRFCGEGWTRNQITFNYQIPGRNITKPNEYLFNYSGIWYEVSNYKLVEWDRMEITADYSYYWNDYRNLLRANANGIIHNSPFIKKEVCACPDFSEAEYDRITTFKLDYALSFDLWLFEGITNGWFKKSFTPALSPEPDLNYFRIGPWKKIKWWERKQWAGDGLDYLRDEDLKNLVFNKRAQLLILTSRRVEKWDKTIKHFVWEKWFEDSYAKIKNPPEKK